MPNCTPHKDRHTLACILIANGVQYSKKVFIDKMEGKIDMKTSTLTFTILGVLFIAFFCLVLVGATVFMVTQSRALNLPENTPNPATDASITLDPSSGYANTPINVIGQNWRPGDVVYIRLRDPSGQVDPKFAYTKAIVDAQGTFVAAFTYPNERRWLAGNQFIVVAGAQTGTESSAPFILVLSAQPTPTPADTATATVADTPTPETTVIVVPVTAAPNQGPGAASLSGTVFDQATHVGIPGTTVSMGDQTTTTDANGQYQFSAVTPGSYSLQAVAPGYNPVTSSVFSMATGDTGQVDLPLTRQGGAVRPSNPAPPPPQNFPDWKGEYYSSHNLTPPPVFVQNDANINFEWGDGSPGPGIPVDNFSVRWTRIQVFDAGVYRFYAQADDGVRAWIDNQLIIDRSQNAGGSTYTVDAYLGPGNHSLRVEYYHGIGYSMIRFWWTLAPQNPPPLPQSFPDWRGEYFSNPDLSDSPLLLRNDPEINFDWNGASPGPGVPGQNFSVRWTRSQDFSKSRTYRFYVTVDDGARMWVDGDRIIDQWQDGPARTFSADKFLDSGNHDLRVEYYNHRGDAVIHVWWVRLQEETDTPTPTSTITRTPTPTSTPAPIPPADQQLIIPVPASGVVGTNVTVAGQGWLAGSTVFLSLADPANAAMANSKSKLASIPKKATVAGFLVDAQGRFTGSILIPTGQGWEGKPSALIIAYTGDLQAAALATFTITTVPPSPTPPATLQLNPPSGPVGSDITVFGFNWPAGSQVFVTLANAAAQSAQVKKSAQNGGVTVDQNGQFQTGITVPTGQGWENQASLLVVALTSDLKVTAASPFTMVQPTVSTTSTVTTTAKLPAKVAPVTVTVTTNTVTTVPSTSTPVPPTTTPVPLTAMSVPPTSTPVPPAAGAELPTATPVPSTATSVPPTSTPVPPTATPVPPTSTPVPPTSTPVPPTTTPVPSTATSVPPTSTPIPPTATPVPPTSTPVPPTATSVPPTATPVPPTETPVPPTATPT